jgi:hypothetical protein
VTRRQGPGHVPPDEQMVGRFADWMNKKDPETGIIRWQGFDARPDPTQSYAVWVLKEFFDHVKGPGFAI